MRPSARAKMRSFLVAPGGARTSVPTTRRARAASRQTRHAAATSSSNPTSSSPPPPPPLAPPPPRPLSSPFLPFGSAAATNRPSNQSSSSSSSSSSGHQGGKILWVQPSTAEAAQAAAEAGVRVLLFDEADVARAADFGGTLARFDAVVRFGDGLLADVTGRSVGVAVELRTPADVRRAEALASSSSSKSSLDGKAENNSSSSSPSSASPDDDDDSGGGGGESVVLADARDWAIIPAESLVAAFQEARRRARASWEEEEAARRRRRGNNNGDGGGDGDGGGNDDGERSPLPKGPKPTPRLLATASTADGALALLGALESGVDGVVLRTGDPHEVRAVCAAVEAGFSSSSSGSNSSSPSVVEERKSTGSSSSSSGSSGSSNSSSGSSNGGSSDNVGDSRIEFEVGVVSSVAAAGMGDRVCVDVTVLLEPGEGLLVGSFAAAALLVHSEREGAQGGGGGGGGDGNSGEAYISPRPFRVNAGAVHSYVAVPRGRTAYLSELKAGSEVLVVRPPNSSEGGRGENFSAKTAAATRAAVVGRAKVERRPMTRVEVRLADGSSCSAVLQNAETVRLVAPKCPSPSRALSASASSSGQTAAEKPPPPHLRSRRRRLGAEDEEALRWAMEPSSSVSSASSSSSPEKLAVDAEKALEWVMGPSASSANSPSSHPLSSSSSPSASPSPPPSRDRPPAALTATPTWTSTSSSSSSSSGEEEEQDDGNESDGAEALVEGPPRRPYLLPRNDSRAVAALRWLLGARRAGGNREEEDDAPSASTSRSKNSSSPPPRFPSEKWNPTETEGWTTVAVTELVPGQPLLVRRAAAARHTGIEIEESIVER